MREFETGDFLFRQGEPATTMFIVVRGVVELTAEFDKKVSLISVIEAGQFLGEKAVLSESPYPRAFNARARARVLVFELGLSDVETLKKTVPELLTDILKQMFLTAAERLDRANGLMPILRSSNNSERVIRLFLFFARHGGISSPKGTQVFLQKSTIHFYLDIPLPQLDILITELVGDGLLSDDGGENYTIPDQKALELSIAAIEKRLSQGSFDNMDTV